MRILVLTALYPPLGASGHDDRCRQVVDALSARGHRLQVLASNHRMPPMGVKGEQGVFRELMLHDPVDSKNSEQFTYRSVLEHELRNARALFGRVDRFKPDVVYVWNMTDLSKSLLFSLQAQGIPVAYDLHSRWLRPEVYDADPWFYWWKHRRGLSTALYKLYLMLSGKRRRHRRNIPIGDVTELDLSGASVCSESLREDLVSLGVSQAAELPVLYPALDTKHLTRKTEYRPVKRFIWAGRLSAAKAPGVALRAISVLKERGINVALDFYGMGEPIERKTMRNLIDTAGLSDSVQMIGIRPGELFSKYPEYDALVFTSHCNDPFPITPLEAMQSGLPCILSRDGGIAEVAEDEESALFYEPGDAEALADAMQRMMAFEDGGEQLAKNCTESLQVRHSLGTVFPQVEAFLSASISREAN